MSQHQGRVTEIMVTKPPHFRYRAFVSWDTPTDHAQEKMHVVNVEAGDPRSETELKAYAEELAAEHGDG